MPTEQIDALVELKDRNRFCKKCQKDFIFPKSEQKFFLKKLLSAPNICPKCREAKKRLGLARAYGASDQTNSYVRMTEYVKIKIVNLSLNRGLQNELEKKTKRQEERERDKGKERHQETQGE